MIKVQIGSETREMDTIDERWLTQQIVRRRQDGLPVCVKVSISNRDADVTFVSAECPATGGGGKALNARENELLDVWCESGMSESRVVPGALLSFLKKIRHL